MDIGQRYTPAEVLEYCRAIGKNQLASRIEEQLDNLDDFVSDGCSWWPDELNGKDYSRCCLIHDIEYWVGGTDDDKFLADLELARCVCKIAGYMVAEVMLAGVRGGGMIGQLLKLSWRWGYGRREKRKVHLGELRY